MSAWTGKPCPGVGEEHPCPNNGKKGPKQADLKHCFRCGKTAKKKQSANAHETRVQREYGLEPGDYQRLKTAQGGRCPICLRANGTTKRLAVDHDHRLEDLGIVSVRGLPCSHCNKQIGFWAHHNPQMLRRAAEYLENPPAWDVLGTREAAVAALAALEEEAA